MIHYYTAENHKLPRIKLLLAIFSLMLASAGILLWALWRRNQDGNAEDGEVVMVVPPPPSIMPSARFSKIVIGGNKLREAGSGSGNFGASRGGGKRSHLGVDISAIHGETVFAPISGKYTRVVKPYPNDTRYHGVEIVGLDGTEWAGYKVKLMYCQPTITVGTSVVAGQPVAVAENVVEKYGGNMKNHLHTEVFKDGEQVDHTTLLFGASGVA
jgi:Peptidase family M23